MSDTCAATEQLGRTLYIRLTATRCLQDIAKPTSCDYVLLTKQTMPPFRRMRTWRTAMTDWIDEITKAIPGITLIAGETAAPVTLPREVLANNIKDNIKLLEYADYKGLERGELRKPTPVFKQSKQADCHDIVFTYCHKKLELKPGLRGLQVPKTLTKTVLERMASEVLNKVYDAQLEAIKAERKASRDAAAITNASENKAAAEKKAA